MKSCMQKESAPVGCVLGYTYPRIPTLLVYLSQLGYLPPSWIPTPCYTFPQNRPPPGCLPPGIPTHLPGYLPAPPFQWTTDTRLLLWAVKTPDAYPTQFRPLIMRNPFLYLNLHLVELSESV